MHGYYLCLSNSLYSTRYNLFLFENRPFLKQPVHSRIPHRFPPSLYSYDAISISLLLAKKKFALIFEASCTPHLLLFTFFFFSPPSNRENTFEKFPFHTRHVYTTDVLTSFRNHQRRAGANLTSRFVSPLVHESENADSGYTANLSLSPSLSLSLPFRIFLAAGRETYIYASSTLKLPSRLSTTSAGSFAFFPWISLAVE